MRPSRSELRNIPAHGSRADCFHAGREHSPVADPLPSGAPAAKAVPHTVAMGDSRSLRGLGAPHSFISHPGCAGGGSGGASSGGRSCSWGRGGPGRGERGPGSCGWGGAVRGEPGPAAEKGPPSEASGGAGDDGLPCVSPGRAAPAPRGWACCRPPPPRHQSAGCADPRSTGNSTSGGTEKNCFFPSTGCL